MEKVELICKSGFWAVATFILAVVGMVGITVLGELAGQWKIINPSILGIGAGFIIGIVAVSSVFFAYGAKTEDKAVEKVLVPREDIEEFSASASRFSPKVVRLKTKTERELEAKETSATATILPQFADADNGRDFSEGGEAIVASNNDNVVPDNDEYDDNDLLDFLASVDSQNDINAYSA